MLARDVDVGKSSTMPARRLHLTGASGAGVTTLGHAVAERLGYDYLDTDDFYWEPTDPPYRVKRETGERLALLADHLDRSEGWVLGGSLAWWGTPLASRFDLVVFLYVPAEERLRRLQQRERERFGDALDPGGAMHEQHQAFLAWAEGYDTGARSRRSLASHAAWLTELGCPVLRIEGTSSLSASIGKVVEAVVRVP